MLRIFWLLLLLLSGFNSFATEVNTPLIKRKEVKNFINEMVNKYHFNRPQLNKVFSKVTIQPSIIRSMERPFEKRNWDVYKRLFLNKKRVTEGLKFWKENSKTLQMAEEKFGVPANIIVAIIGVETLYGQQQGNHKVIDALSTLAFDYPKRSAFFTKELREYLILCKEHGVNPHRYHGSYAGAMGKPQFMPSSYRAYATHFNKNAKKDLMNDNQAVIASVANYFKAHGWSPNQGIVQPATINNKSVSNIKINTRRPQYKLKELEKFGVKPITAALNTPNKVGLIKLKTDKGPEYWLAYPNFYVITRYNTSPQYALAVYLLAQQLKRQWAQATLPHPYAYA